MTPSFRLALLGLLALAVPASAAEPPGKLWVYVGTYSNEGSQGIYRFDLDQATGKLGERELAVEAKDPSFLAIAPDHRFLYAVSEVGSFNDQPGGAVNAYRIDPATGKLTLLNQQTSGGSGPCHLTTDRAGKHVLVANYGGGSIESLPIGEDGRLGKPTTFIQHQGTGPHAHSINVDAGNRFAVVADLGLDQMLVYHFDPATGKLMPNDPPTTANAGGPRHFAFHPTGKYAYVINEKAMSVTAFAYDGDKGTLKPIQTITTLPEGVEGKGFSTAEVQVHPSGLFLYGSNRGQNSIAIFSIDPDTGKLSARGHQGQNVKVPRNFGIDPTGKYLIVANQAGNTIEVFAIDAKTGDLKPTGQIAEVVHPVCVKFMPRP